jgi:hypothetical protein
MLRRPSSLTNTAIMLAGIFKAPNLGHGSDPIVTRMIEQDKVPWYKKPNLRRMYFYLFVCCMGVEITSGFDSQLINTLQFSPPFNKCKCMKQIAWTSWPFSAKPKTVINQEKTLCYTLHWHSDCLKQDLVLYPLRRQ